MNVKDITNYTYTNHINNYTKRYSINPGVAEATDKDRRFSFGGYRIIENLKGTPNRITFCPNDL